MKVKILIKVYKIFQIDFSKHKNQKAKKQKTLKHQQNVPYEIIKMISINKKSIIIQMFKQQKENNILTQQSINFISRQLTYLNNIAHKLQQFEPTIVRDQIQECTQMIQKKIINTVGKKNGQEFYDYVSDFYQNKLEMLRKELNLQIKRRKALEQKIQECQGDLRSKEDQIIRCKPFDISVVNQNLSLKNELLQSQKLIAQNQKISQEQNNLITQLKACLLQAQDRQAYIKSKYQHKIKQLDEAINSKRKRVAELTKQFQAQSKKMDRQFRQTQLQNISLLQQKQQLQSEIILKSQEIKLLGKKIYQQSMVIGKYQRQLQFSSQILEQQRVNMNRTVDDTKKLKEKLRQAQKQYEQMLKQKKIEIKQLQQKIQNLSTQNKHLNLSTSKNTKIYEKYQLDIQTSKQVISKLEKQTHQLQCKFIQKEKNCRKLEKKEKQYQVINKELEECIREREQEISMLKGEIFSLKKEIDKCTNAHFVQKQQIKKNIEEEFNNLATLNKQILQSLQKVQTQSQSLKKENQNLKQKNLTLLDNIQQLSLSFQSTKTLINKTQQQKEDLQYIKNQLEQKLKQTQKKYTQLLKIQQEKQELQSKMIELQGINAQSNKILKEKINQIQKFKKNAKDDSFNKDIQDNQTIKILKEQACKKEFMLRQANAKLNQTQIELREVSKQFLHEKESMKKQICEMQKIIQDNFDHSSGSHRLIDSTIV